MIGSTRDQVEIEESIAANERELEQLRDESVSKDVLIGQLNAQLLESRDLLSRQQQHLVDVGMVGCLVI